MEHDNTAAGGSLPLVTRIVSSYARHNTIAAEELPGLISRVHLSLSGLGHEAPPAEALVPAVSVKRSVRRDFVVCLDCGFRSRMLRRHLMTAHRLEPAEYRARWRLAPDHPITAPSYSAHRSGLAKQNGLGRKRAAASPTLRGRGRPRRPQPAA